MMLPVRVFVATMFCAVMFSAAATTTGAAEPEVDARDLPRTLPVEPTNVFSTFQIKPGFRLDLVAAEPLVVDPIAMSFDENGRLYVIEMRDYSERRDERLGRVRLLEDVDGDGIYDKSTVFAQDLPWPTAIICYDGGVFVGATPDIIYFKDTNGDGIADERRVVFTGFADTGERLNVQALMNSFNWTLDNRIHGATGPMGGKVRCISDPGGKILELRGKDFSFDPRNPKDIRPESGGGQNGLTFTDDGRKLVCHNSAHIRLAMYEERYAGRNPYYSMPPPLIDIPVDGPAAEVYRISPPEPWRVIRTAWRVAGKVSGPIEGGGRASGYFTSATGITIYRGNAFPEDFLGDAFIADIGSNLIHRKKLYPKDVPLEAKRAPDEENVEFLASKDLWFRPVQFANAPDGCLYFADMYREVVEHPWSIPESIKKHLDLNSGNDRGRIYRITPKGFEQPKPPRLANASTAELVKLLEHKNGWYRDTAARLLYQRQDKSSVPLLQTLFEQTSFPIARWHALYALNGQSALNEAILSRALDDKDERVREHAIRLSEQYLRGRASSKLISRLSALRADPSARVRYQLAFTVGEIPITNKAEVLAEIIRRNPDSAWTQAAVLNSIGQNASDLFMAMTPSAGNSAAFLARLSEIIGGQNKESQIQSCIRNVLQLRDEATVFRLTHALSEGLRRSGKTLQDIAPETKPVYERAAKSLSDSHRPDDTRIAAAPLVQQLDPLLKVLDTGNSEPIQRAALDSMSRISDARLGAELLSRWFSLTPRLRSQTMSLLLARPERIRPLLEAVGSGKVQPSELTTAQIKFLRSNRDSELRSQAEKLFGAQTAKRQAVVDQFLPALQLQGKADAGQTIYRERCASCHRAAGEGFQLGPDLVTVKTAGKEKLLINILDPNRELLPNYVSYLVETKTGDSYIGILGNESASSITIREAFGKETVVARDSVKRIDSQKQSLMPEGLEAGLSARQIADLLAFITEAK